MPEVKGASVVPDGMKHGATSLENSEGTIRNFAMEVRDCVSRLNVDWTGTAAHAFVAAMEVWNQEVSDILRAMTWLRENLVVGANTYAAAQEDVEQAIQRLQTTMTTTPLFHT